MTLPLELWNLPGKPRAELINVSENRTFLVEAQGGFRAVLREHRAGYHSRAEIESELAWMAALGAGGVTRVPVPVAGRDGAMLQGDRPYVLFEFIEGAAPDEDGDLVPGFETLGGIAARLHGHVRGWTLPDGFTRKAWDLGAVFGAAPIWGNWRDAPGVTPAIRPMLERAEARVCDRLQAFGQGPDRHGLIHADMRLANLLVQEDDIRLIDFDDCGFGWFLYDFAAAVSFMETRDDLADLKAAWLRGYRAVAPLSVADEAEIDTFVMLRRFALLAWIGSHMEAPEPQAMAPHFAQGTADLAAAFLASS